MRSKPSLFSRYSSAIWKSRHVDSRVFGRELNLFDPNSTIGKGESTENADASYRTCEISFWGKRELASWDPSKDPWARVQDREKGGSGKVRRHGFEMRSTTFTLM